MHLSLNEVKVGERVFWFMSDNDTTPRESVIRGAMITSDGKVHVDLSIAGHLQIERCFATREIAQKWQANNLRTKGFKLFTDAANLDLAASAPASIAPANLPALSIMPKAA